jgi:hypothetical protein
MMVEETEGPGRRCKQLLNYLKGMRGCYKLKEEALDCPQWRSRFVRGYGHFVTLTG